MGSAHRNDVSGTDGPPPVHVISLYAPVVGSLMFSSTRIEPACVESHRTAVRLFSAASPLVSWTVNWIEPAPCALLASSATTSVRNSQSAPAAPVVGASLHCTIDGVAPGVRPVHETVATVPSVVMVLGETVTVPTAPAGAAPTS